MGRPRPATEPRRQAAGWQRELQGKEIRAALRPGMTEAEIQAAAERLLDLAA
ncbi:aminopeptidase P family protein [Fimbriiglobus ruber]|uniref:aminopeptidase P family protein n=1 Tax=Fimbriiglobus ruber TaxID=1908690 RepID=UPI00117AF088|nr:aminopeptidase P family protein [Fimbriiglobus ruber]